LLALPAAILGGALAGFLLSFLVQPVFIADARVLVGTGGGLSAGLDPNAAGLMESEVAVLRSRELAGQAVRRHDLARRLDRATRPSALDTMLVAAGLRTNPSSASIEERALDALEAGLSVEPIGSSRVIAVTFSGSSASLAASVSNAVAETYVNDITIAAQRSGQANLQWLQGEIETMRERVAEAERRVDRYRSEIDPLGTLASTRRTDLATQEFSALNAELVRARAAHAEAQARAKVVRQILKQGSSVEAARDVLESPLIQRLREQQVRLQSEKAELTSTYLPGHPKIESLQAQQDDLDSQIRDEIRKVLKSVEMTAEISSARVESLRESLEQLKSTQVQGGDAGVELRALQQDARAQRELLETFLTRYRTLSAQAGGERPIARIISRARPPAGPSRPLRPLWAAYGGLSGLAAAFMLALFGRISGAERVPREQTEQSELVEILRTVQQQMNQAEAVTADSSSLAERKPLASNSEEIPEGDEQADAAAAEHAGHDVPPEDKAAVLPVSEPARNAHAAPAASRSHARPSPLALLDTPGTAELGRALVESPARIILFAGASGTPDIDHGCDRIAFAAAAHAGGEGCRCVLLDIGLRPSPLLTPDVRAPGLGHLISGTVPFGHTLRCNEEYGFDMIGMGRALGNPPLKRLTTVVASLAKRYDKVILVADRVEDWPDRFVRPDFAVLICDPDLDEANRRGLYQRVVKRGARQALIVRNRQPVHQAGCAAA
jgi:uncharacterized protein involved in exopolysaccharide biosynthesis